MSTANASRVWLLGVLCLLVLATSLHTVHALSIDSVSVTPSNATTTATLSCLVNVTGTGTLTADITWFNNGVAHNSDDETISLTSGVQGSTTVVGNIEAVDTTKGDSWICQATASNTTSSAIANSSAAVIINSPPQITFPTTSQTVIEDNTYSQTATASDADGDSIVTFISSDLNASQYSGVSLFSIGSGGAISFSPPQSAVGNHTMAILAYDGESFGGSNVLYTIVQVDDPPIFNLLPVDKNATVGINFSVLITGADEEAIRLTFP